MEAGKNRQGIALFFAICVGTFAIAPAAIAANYRTQNFLIQAPTPDLARAVGEAAEAYRRDLAVHWLGNPIPPWPTPCPVRVIAGNMPAQGVTTYNRAPVRDFQMEVVGTPERILDSVLPHEVTHTVLATHFGRPLPRWADEGICTTVEHDAERSKHEAKLREFLASRRGIAMNRMFLLTEYPNDVLPLYAQGYSVCRFLIEQQGPQAFIGFLEGYMQHPSWTDNIRQHYGYESLAELQDYWLGWVAAGSGPVERFVKAGHQSAGSIATRGEDAATSSIASNLTMPNEDTGQTGWYLRRRQGETEENDTRTRSLASRELPNPQLAGATRELLATPVPERDPSTLPPMAASPPPSVKRSGYYSAAQPQPEQSFSGVDFSSPTPSAAVTPSAAGDFDPYYFGGQNSPATASGGNYYR